jgi:type IV pilus assembly protein PilO
MTYTEDYTTTTVLDTEFDESANYPTAFGITFTPQVTGIALAVLGVAGAFYVLFNFFLPAWDEYQKLKTDEAAKQQEVDLQKASKLEQKIAEAELKLKQAEDRKQQVLALFASAGDLQTILLDVSKLFQSRNVKLTSFTPQGDPVIIGDESLGPGSQNKLKRQTFQVAFKGSFGNTHNLIRDLERLQPLILMRDFKTDLMKPDFPVVVVRSDNQVHVKAEPNDALSTSMLMDVLLPLSPEELAALAPPPPPPGAAPAPGASPPPAK